MGYFLPRVKETKFCNTILIHVHVVYFSLYLHEGEGSCGLNFHNLSHLVKYVKAWGLLWAWSCFGFENMNGEVLKLVHSTGNVAKEVQFFFFSLYFHCYSSTDLQF